jgi:hypothetical protein
MKSRPAPDASGRSIFFILVRPEASGLSKTKKDTCCDQGYARKFSGFNYVFTKDYKNLEVV